MIVNLVAFGIALLAVFVFEVIKRPRLTVELHDDRYQVIDAIKDVRQAALMVRLKTINRPIYKNWIQRNTATNCRSRITIVDDVGKILQKDIATKWTARRTPFTLFPGPYYNIPTYIIDDNLVEVCDRLDIYANYCGEELSVAQKVEGDANCYLFTGESYRSNNQYRLPKYRIPQGEYILEIFIEGDNAKSPNKKYKLRNQGQNKEGLTLDLC